jgi:two-component system, NtrC family, nitrogen regulation sensor histidine kinase NtrY
MVYPHFYVNVVVRLLLLTASCMGFAFSWYGSGNYITLFNLGLLILIQTILFIIYANRTNRDLTYFFESIKNEDSGISFSRTKRQYQGIYKSMDHVNDQIMAFRMTCASRDQYFKTIVESIQTGIISFGTDGKIDIMNKAAKSILGVNTFYRIESFNKIQPGLGDALKEIGPSEKILVRVNSGNATEHLLVSSTKLKLIDKKLKIITFHNIQQELDKKELESWQKLIRILNHEIMNSLAPIISTSTTLRSILSGKNTSGTDDTDQSWNRVLEKTISGLSIIHERSEGLKSFVENYRTLNTLPKPIITKFAVKELFNNCKLLLSEELSSRQISCTTEIVVQDMELSADRPQIEQILLNLLKNSIESLSETTTDNKVIHLKALFNDNGKAVLQVLDNGKGIPPEIIDQIFIPFFTTKKGGTGIGLSLSRQIMHLHHGTMSAFSVPYHETLFTMTF